MTIDTQVKMLARICGENVLRSALGNIARMELQKCQMLLAKIDQELVVFEKQFSLSSAEAWKKYSAGELGDRMDLMEWMAVYQNRLSIQKNVQQLNQTIES